MKEKIQARWSVLDLFLILLILTAVLAVYFTFAKPLHFSHLIKREAIHRYVEMEMLLPDDLSWIKEKLPAGEEYRNVYGELDWRILEFGEETLNGRKWVKVKVKILVDQESSGLLRYGKYTLVSGNKIYLINDRYFLEGRVLNYRILDDEVRL